MILKILVFVLSAGFCFGVKLKMLNNVTEAEYYRMPELFLLDDFDRCLSVEENKLYCNLNIQLSPENANEPSEVWSIVQEVISLPRNYRHDQIRRGSCIPQNCPEIPKELYAVGNGTEELWHAVSKCYSRKYQHIGIKAKVRTLHCENDTPFYEVDNVDRLYAYVVLSIAAFVIFSSFVEGFARFGDPKTYQQFTEGSFFGRLITCFSLAKNWDRLGSESNSAEALALAPIQGVRVYNMFFVIMSHSALFAFMMPVSNPLFNENVNFRVENAFLTNGSLICETNFMMTGFLLAYHFYVTFENKNVEFKHLALALLNRFIRLVPIALIMIGFSATWLRHISRGPLWEQAVGGEFNNCRKNWLLNVFFLNNYINTNEMCLQQTWYSAADMQLFILGLFIIMYAINHPENANKVFGTFIILGMLGTFAQHYYREYDIVSRSWPENLHTLFLQHDFWLDMFIPGHHHMSCFVLGLACGFYFVQYQKENKALVTSKVGYLLWAIYVWVGSIGTILIAALFYQDGYEHTRFGAAFYQAISRMSFGLPIAICIFGMVTGIGWRMRSVCAWKPMQVLGRLTFCAYLVHVGPMRIKGGTVRSPIYVTDYTILHSTFGDVFVAYLLATVVCLFFEMPISALQKLFLSPPKKIKAA